MSSTDPVAARPAASGHPRGTVVAAGLTTVTGLAFIGVGVAVVAARVALFSAGVAVMLVVYGVLVALVGWAVWRGHGAAFGACVTVSLIHLLVLVNLARHNHAALFAPLALVPLAVLVCLFTPATRRALGRG